jgi:hypothetical protein
MKFRLLEHPDSKSRPENRKKRVIKAQSKNVSYTASSQAINSSERNQCLDYYIGVASHKDGETKVYTVPVSCPYQF